MSYCINLDLYKKNSGWATAPPLRAPHQAPAPDELLSSFRQGGKADEDGARDLDETNHHPVVVTGREEMKASRFAGYRDNGGRLVAEDWIRVEGTYLFSCSVARRGITGPSSLSFYVPPSRRSQRPPSSLPYVVWEYFSTSASSCSRAWPACAHDPRGWRYRRWMDGSRCGRVVVAAAGLSREARGFWLPGWNSGELDKWIRVELIGPVIVGLYVGSRPF
jgi:hypothetical protein